MDKIGFSSKNRVLYLKSKKERSLTFSGMRISEQTDYWGLPSYSSETFLVGEKSVPELEYKASRVLMTDMNGYLKDSNGYGIFKSTGILAVILPLDLFKWTSIAMGPD
ncbi:uncharacterized protein WM294_001674 isoform 1-T3 [Sarcoramphus papa]